MKATKDPTMLSLEDSAGSRAESGRGGGWGGVGGIGDRQKITAESTSTMEVGIREYEYYVSPAFLSWLFWVLMIAVTGKAHLRVENRQAKTYYEYAVTRGIATDLTHAR